MYVSSLFGWFVSLPAANIFAAIILAVARGALTLQYIWVVLHFRKYGHNVTPLLFQIGTHIVSAVVFLGIAFAFTSTDNHVYLTWYFFAGAEALITIGISFTSSLVELRSTHLMKRMALLTVLILGEGIESLTQNVIKIVNGPTIDGSSAVDSVARGSITASASTIYFVFLVYFDWIGERFHLTATRQAIWTVLHLPFHLSLVLFMQGYVQLLTWGKIIQQLFLAFDIADPTDSTTIPPNATSISVTNALNSSVQGFFKAYPPVIDGTLDTVNAALTNISHIPDSFWAPFAATSIAGDGSDGGRQLLPPSLQPNYDVLVNATTSLALSMANAVFSSFGINLQGDVIDSGSKPGTSDFQFQVQESNWERYGVVVSQSASRIVDLVGIKDYANPTLVSVYAHRRWLRGAFHADHQERIEHHPAKHVVDPANRHYFHPRRWHYAICAHVDAQRQQRHLAALHNVRYAFAHNLLDMVCAGRDYPH